MPVDEISLVGRNTQGVRLITLTNEELLVSLEQVATLKETESTENKGDDEKRPRDHS
jgi:DNA gyrase subunit A